MKMSWVIKLATMVTLCSGQCAFNTVSVMLGTNRYTGLTAAGINVTGANCVAQDIVGEGNECDFSQEGYINSVTARCTSGVFVYQPSNATMMPTECGTNPGTATPTAVHYFGEMQTYDCPSQTSCSQYPCESSCSAGALDTPLYCYSNCQLGTPIGITVTTLSPGPEGANCSSSSIAVDSYSPVCGVNEQPGYSCGTIPSSVTCQSSQAGNLITATCLENVCYPIATIPVAGVIGYPGNGDTCPDSNIVLSVLSDSKCDIMCDQSAGYEAQIGNYTCGSSQNLGVQNLVSSITQCIPVTCPANSTAVALRQCVCDSGFEGTITYNGTAFVGGCSPISCSPFVIPPYAVSGDVNGCFPNEVLTSVRPQCTIKCASGYIDSSAVVTCDFGSSLLSQTSLQCVEKVCTPHNNFGVGVTTGSVGGCSQGATLRAVSDPTCSLTCSDGYFGTDGVLECLKAAPNNSPPVEMITCSENTCIPPGNTFPGHTFVGTSSICNTVTGCGEVKCLDGYDGMPVLSCPVRGGVFSIADPCVAVPCPENASPLGSCNCNVGYQVEGGGAVAFNITSANWDHECEATCSHPSFAGCDPLLGYFLADQPETIACSGVSGIPAVDCDTATCCRQSCSAYTCSTGYTLQAQALCSQNGCTDDVCCFANCANPLYTTCQQNGFAPYPVPEGIPCLNNSVSSCDSNTCCISASCSSVVCSEGMHLITPSPSCSNCTAAVCCEENSCQQLSNGQLPQYIVEGGTTCTTVSGCGTVMCAAGYRAESSPALTCSAHFGSFMGTGCVENTCLPTPLPGYKVLNPQCNSVTNCGVVQCDTGYTSDGGNPSLFCPTHAGPLYGSGCRENVCKPQDLSKVQSYATAVFNCTTASECGQITCARGYTMEGTPTISCLTEGGELTVTGCKSNTCLSPLVLPGNGFTASTPSCTRTEQCGTVECSDDLYLSAGAVPTLVCPYENGEFEVFGCVGPTQAPPTALPTEAPFTPVPPPPGVTVSPEAHCGVCPDRTVCRFVTLTVNDYMCVSSCDAMNCGSQQECTADSTGYSVCVDRVVTPKPTAKPTPRPITAPPVTPPPTVTTPTPGNSSSSANPNDDGSDTNLTWLLILFICLFAAVVALIVIKVLFFTQKPASRLGEFLQGVDPEISFSDSNNDKELTPNFRSQAK